MSSDPNSDPNTDPSVDPFPNITASANGRPYFKPDPEFMKKINPKVFPELSRYQYKYTRSTNKGRQIYILVQFTATDDGNSRADWSLYVDDDMSEDEEPLLEVASSSKEFHDMLDAEDWKQVGEGLVIVK